MFFQKDEDKAKFPLVRFWLIWIVLLYVVLGLDHVGHSWDRFP